MRKKYAALFAVWLSGFVVILGGAAVLLTALPAGSAALIASMVLTVVAIVWGVSVLTLPYLAYSWHRLSRRH